MCIYIYICVHSTRCNRSCPAIPWAWWLVASFILSLGGTTGPVPWLWKLVAVGTGSQHGRRFKLLSCSVDPVTWFFLLDSGGWWLPWW